MKFYIFFQIQLKIKVTKYKSRKPCIVKCCNLLRTEGVFNFFHDYYYDFHRYNPTSLGKKNLVWLSHTERILDLVINQNLNPISRVGYMNQKCYSMQSLNENHLMWIQLFHIFPNSFQPRHLQSPSTSLKILIILALHSS